MSDQRDPRVRALIVELSGSSPQAPVFAEIEDRAAEPIGDGSVRPLGTLQRAEASRWTLGVGAAAALVLMLLIGGPLLLLSGATNEDAEPLAQIDVETTVTARPTTIASTNSSVLTQTPTGVVWTGPIDPITLTVNPAVVPAEEGSIDVTVSGETVGGFFWLAVCPGARGNVDPAEWPDWDGWTEYSVAEYCGPSAVPQNPTVDSQGRFTSILQVSVDAQAIEDGGITITTGDIFTGLRGNTIVRVGSGSLNISARELLQAGDLPGGYGWTVLPIDDERWNASGTNVHFCSAPNTALDAWLVDVVPPLSSLSNGPVRKSFEGAGIGIQEVLYSDTESAVKTVFDSTVAHLEVCLEEPKPTFGIAEDSAAEGAHWETGRFELPAITDDSYAIRYSLVDSGLDGDYWLNLHHTMAVVRKGGRLAVIELHTAFHNETLKGPEFSVIVENAILRLSE